MIRAYNQRAPEEQRLDGRSGALYRLVLEFYTELEILGYDVQDYAIILGSGEQAARWPVPERQLSTRPRH